MDILYKNNRIKINNKIASLQQEKKKKEKNIKICKEMFTPLSLLHITFSGMYGLIAIVGAVINKTLIPMYFVSPIAVGILSSCAITLGINEIVKTINENKKGKIEKEIDNYQKMLEEYDQKDIKQNFKDMNKNMRSKQPQKTERKVNTYEYTDMYEMTQEEGPKLSLKK